MIFQLLIFALECSLLCRISKYTICQVLVFHFSRHTKMYTDCSTRFVLVNLLFWYMFIAVKTAGTCIVIIVMPASEILLEIAS